MQRLLEKWSYGEIAGANLRVDTVMIIVSGAIIFFLLDRFVTKSRTGKAIRAVSMSEENSKLMGINLNKVVQLYKSYFPASFTITETTIKNYFLNFSTQSLCVKIFLLTLLKIE